MKRTSLALALILCSVVLTADVSAQPILNRVEQLLRNQAASAKSAEPGEAAEPGYLGVIADDRQEGGRGVRVLEVVPDGPAAKGGLRQGDLITAINGQSVRVMDDMASAVERASAGAKLTIMIDRGGAPRQQEVTLGRRPASQPIGKIPESLPEPNAPAASTTAPGPRLGVRSLPVSEEVQRQNNLSTSDGAMIISVTVGSPADRAGIPLGAVITAVDGKAIQGPSDLSNAIRTSGDDLELTFVLRGQEVRKSVSLAASAPSLDAPKLELRGRPLSQPAPGQSEPSEEASATVAELQARIRTLEERLEKLEAALSGERK